MRRWFTLLNNLYVRLSFNSSDKSKTVSWPIKKIIIHCAFYITGKLSHDDKSGKADQDAGFATVTEYSIGKKSTNKGLY